jgi:universal stress protein A
MKTIVLGYDGSAEAGRAVTRAADLAKAHEARVVVTSVAPILQSLGRGTGPYDPADPPERHAALATDAATILERQGVDAKAVPSLGEPGDTIVRVADEHGADLIVLGMAHHSRLARVLGSVSDDVAHRAHCDVLLVR